MAQQDNIDHIFRNRLHDVETPVSPEVWTKVSAGIAKGTAATVASKSVLSSFKLAVTGVISVATLTAIMIVVMNNGSDQKTKKKQIAIQPQIAKPSIEITPKVEEALPSKNKESASEPVNNFTRPIKAESGASSYTKKPDTKGSNTYETTTGNEEPVTIHSSVGNNDMPAKNSTTTHETQSSIDESLPVAGVNEKTPETPQTTPPDEQKYVAQKWTEAEFDNNIKINTNIITPNDDNMNDFFTVDAQNVRTFNLIIFDRNGKNIAQYSVAGAQWDGKLKNGDRAAAGTYFYFIFGESADGKTYDRKGLLTLQKTNNN